MLTSTGMGSASNMVMASHHGIAFRGTGWSEKLAA